MGGYAISIIDLGEWTPLMASDIWVHLRQLEHCERHNGKDKGLIKSSHKTWKK